MAVGHKASQREEILKVDNDGHRNNVYRLVRGLKHYSLANQIPVVPRIFASLEEYAEPIRFLRNYLGCEDFVYPGSNNILRNIPWEPDVIHIHSLHSGFFDLRYLAELSQHYPVFLTLHDCWMLTGHCAYPYDCSRWKDACGKCPYLTRSIAINKDASSYNLRRKKDIYSRSKLYVSAPSNWLSGMVRDSVLQAGSLNVRTVPNGVDSRIFKYKDKYEARDLIGEKRDDFIILFIGNNATINPAKGFGVMQKVVETLSTSTMKNITLLVLGDSFEERRYNNIRVKGCGWISSLEDVASYHQASDLYVHFAIAENFPTVILEAMSCGKPVLASNIGGIPEQIVEGETGYLFENNEIKEISNRIISLVDDTAEMKRMGDNALKIAQEKYTLKRMAKDYINWFEEVLEND